ncbi:MAG: TetR/AcrR family transcriptional regulator [Lachnospiraceae bacterium]|nr:TetR/AcrR family transcriptional regulator [Lachnospiraceae bacterium]
MPKNTFFRIAEEKRKRIIAAAQTEFLNHPYNEVSINQIIKNARIPRGSFYQYFNDKEDLFLYVISEHKKIIQDEFVKGMEKNNGDLFACVDYYLDMFFNSIYTNRSGIYNIVTAEPLDFDKFWGFGFAENQPDECIFKHYVNNNTIDVEDDIEAEAFINIFASIVRDTIGKVRAAKSDGDMEMVKKSFINQVNSLRKHYQKKTVD